MTQYMYKRGNCFPNIILNEELEKILKNKEIKMAKCFVFAGVLLMLFSTAGCFQCSSGPPGQYCTKDLTGYHNCPNYGVKPTIIPCPVNTRCSCFLRNKCTVDKDKVCAPYTKPHQLIKDFELRYHGKVSTVNIAGRHNFQLQGHVLQNFATKRLSKTEWIGSKRHFEVVHPLKNGKFVRYTGNYPNVCHTTILQSFPEFGPDLTRFTLTSSHKRKYFYEETWKLLVGRHTPYEPDLIQETWKMAYSRWTHKMRPLSYSYELEGGRFSRTNKKIKFTVGLFYRRIGLENEWFKKPSFC
ncbi:uncharacterized protein LOC130649350 [Hydractinia symbiolongicarpus]|uniref:uncharacterized protein LOC130649350 n=1 Tax=Hydractinia symbiolongicarpus TaxID=13093 RepID=UPI0025516E70|nr:uncharacterized protein LOC130649350 [Hydractinia symbiolongicarpus]